MAHPAGESDNGGLQPDFDRRLMLQFRGPIVSPDAGLLDRSKGVVRTTADRAGTDIRFWVPSRSVWGFLGGVISG
jgi:hypothetical protein